MYTNYCDGCYYRESMGTPSPMTTGQPIGQTPSPYSIPLAPPYPIYPSTQQIPLIPYGVIPTEPLNIPQTQQGPFPTTQNIPTAQVPMGPGAGAGMIPGMGTGTADFEMEAGAPVQQDINYTQGYLRTQIGKRVKIEFLIGTNMLVDREGILLGVGISYVLLQESETDDLLLCDIYSIKFVKVYY
jgi:hypothetical protein